MLDMMSRSSRLIFQDVKIFAPRRIVNKLFRPDKCFVGMKIPPHFTIQIALSKPTPHFVIIRKWNTFTILVVFDCPENFQRLLR
ncbi:hypothetical protein WN944_013047 [Citrus x changshan-huyou]|uniref:Uncharacterized protein n=1 Tax=Citrus x changshan-huyou TaxID=2935761 RepID=A0AAP0M4B1_9ROSI